MAANALTLGDIGSWDAPVGSPPWVKRTHVEALTYLERTESDAEHLDTYVQSLLRDNNYQKLTDAAGRPFLLWETYCTTPPPFGLGMAPRALRALIAERKSAQARASEAVPLGPAQHAGPGRGKKTSSDNTRLDGRGADYQVARIARDAPGVLEAMQRGEHRSVRAAARAAGLVKERWSVPAHSIAAMADYLLTRLSPADRAELARRLGEL